MMSSSTDNLQDLIYRIDVSKRYCWKQVIDDHKSSILDVMNKMRPLFAPYISIVKTGLYTYKACGGVILYEQEIKDVAELLGITFTECLIFQMMYELHSACTSAILRCPNVNRRHKYVHVRTMDWSISPEDNAIMSQDTGLKEITVRISVYNKTEHLFDAVTWAGFLGIFTGIKPGKYTIALNYRKSASPNFLESITACWKGYYPNAMFIRNLLSSNDSPNIIKEAKLIAPAYYTVMCCIVRDRENYWIKKAPVVQTNCDEVGLGDNIMFSYERSTYMTKILNSELELDDLIEYIDKFPIVNSHTVYTVIMTSEGYLYYKK